LTKEEYEFIGKMRGRNTVTAIEQTEVNRIYNRVFKDSVKPTNCGSCLRGRVQELETLYNAYVKGGNHPNTIWVEFKNVNGDAGWMYGKAEYIAFDMPEMGGFVMVRTNELRNLCEAIVEPVFVTKQEATRKFYQRDGRQDVISRLELQDLQTLVSFKVLNYANPETTSGEKQSDYIQRCMEAIASEYTDKDQAVAVCYTQWKEGK
jgi:hypothetical protein